MTGQFHLSEDLFLILREIEVSSLLELHLHAPERERKKKREKENKAEVNFPPKCFRFGFFRADKGKKSCRHDFMFAGLIFSRKNFFLQKKNFL